MGSDLGRAQTRVKKGEGAVERVLRRLPLGVDEVHGEDRVGEASVAMRVILARVDLDALEAVAELALEGVEALAGAERVAGEAHPQDADALFVNAPPE